MIFLRLLRSIVRRDSLTVIDRAGRRHLLGDGSPPVATLRLSADASDWKLVRNPVLGIGEAYMDGSLTVDDGRLYEVLDLLARNYGKEAGHPWMSLLERVTARLKQSNPLGRAQSNVAHHYDLSPALYDLFLDSDRQYSCAYFRSPDDTLEEAQLAKKRHIAAKLMLDRPGLKVLDIGSGWGGMALYLAEAYGAEVTGVTLSEEQFAHSQARAAASPTRERVSFHLRDYREQQGPFDRIVSIGMFEHVGKRHYLEYFTKLRELLAPDGVALIHSIGYSDEPAPINPFIRKYIFPGADLPSMSEVFAAVEKTGLFATDVEILRLHYAETLRHWRERFLAHREEVLKIYDARFLRMWEFYLALCEVGFRQRTNIVFQLQLTKRIDTVPITRDYMAEAERAAEAREAKR
ncbi:cyclopropane-fatty-acyl-phospholipid synthase family protein [Stappia sp. P2PMeth1]|uniref:SAM-dependent methyltransferase n=1 Tax=Stappia sp. P2PMeth1 TaxID=2003586 RepID=UPI0016486A2F|nr:cyclopropane-fatty-acyl-phospholipid synthase family protein [Stappia sp. P2PMeth1]